MMASGREHWLSFPSPAWLPSFPSEAATGLSSAPAACVRPAHPKGRVQPCTTAGWDLLLFSIPTHHTLPWTVSQSVIPGAAASLQSLTPHGNVPIQPGRGLGQLI